MLSRIWEKRKPKRIEIGGGGQATPGFLDPTLWLPQNAIRDADIGRGLTQSSRVQSNTYSVASHMDDSKLFP